MTIRFGAMALIIVAAGLTLPASADVVYMTDGFALHGKVTRQMELIVDPATGQPIPIVKNSPCFIVDDRVRYTLFSQRNVANDPDKDTNIYDGHIILQMPVARTGQSRPAEASIGEATPFNEKWERTIRLTQRIDMAKLLGPGAPINPGNRFKIETNKVRQKISMLSPYFMRVECIEYNWTANYMTSEFGPAVVLPLVRAHPEIKETGAPDFEKRFKLFRFCTQAGWYEDALRELNILKKHFPDQAQKTKTAETGLRQLIQQRIMQDAELAAKVGRHNRVQELLKQLVVADLPVPLQTDAANLKSRYEMLQTKLEQTRHALAICYQDVVGPPIDFVGDAMPTICQELNFDTLDRLEPFTALGRQIESDRKNGKATQYSLDQVLASAVTGWVLGPVAAEASIASADRLWSVRQQILAIQRTGVPIDRARMTTELERSAGLTIDEIARAITLLPPPESEPVPAAGVPIERQTRNAFSGQLPVRYRLQLPAEYNPNRAYPMLLILPNAGQSTLDAMTPWAAEGLTHGHILAAIDWGTLKNAYEYKESEHSAVIECLRDVKRFVNVDTDRVSLTGHGEGANMAIDVGLSHPDLFAAVVPINGRPRAFISSWYWRHAQVLPFYIVLGELTGSVNIWALDLYVKWAEKGYASLLVMYKGRPIDFFPGEVPNIFDWLDRKRRATGFPSLGRNPGAGTGGEEYHSFRTTDNHFYWASSEQFDKKIVLEDFLGQKLTNPAAIQATIRDANQITVHTRGVKQLTLWFGRAYDDQGGTRDMIDFTKPIKITVNGRNPWTNNGQPLTPKLETLMEDLFQRNDRRRLFLARVDFNNIQ